MIEERADGWAVILPHRGQDYIWPGYAPRALAEEVETRNRAILAQPLIVPLAQPNPQPPLFDEEET